MIVAYSTACFDGGVKSIDSLCGRYLGLRLGRWQRINQSCTTPRRHPAKRYPRGPKLFCQKPGQLPHILEINLGDVQPCPKLLGRPRNLIHSLYNKVADVTPPIILMHLQKMRPGWTPREGGALALLPLSQLLLRVR
jgi:hypothetical protein